MKIRTDSLFATLFLVFLLGILQYVAFEHYLYWTFWWYDVMMHFLGGVVASALFIWFVAFEFPERWQKTLLTLASVLAFTFVVGVFWELFEYQIGIDKDFSWELRAWDTAIDLAMDVLGGGVAFVTFKFFKHAHV